MRGSSYKIAFAHSVPDRLTRGSFYDTFAPYCEPYGRDSRSRTGSFPVIIDTVRGDIFRSGVRHCIFAINAEGHNDEGFAGLVSRRFWPELAHTGGNTLGDVLKLKTANITLYAVVCHKQELGGWSQTPKFVEMAVNKLSIPADEAIGVVLMGGGPVGQSSGADTFAILGALARTNKRLVVYTL